jgi:hypothetical protein
MSIFCFALVPIYDVFCSITGLNGKVDISKFGTYDASDKGINKSRIISIEFDVTYNKNIQSNTIDIILDLFIPLSEASYVPNLEISTLPFKPVILQKTS